MLHSRKLRGKWQLWKTSSKAGTFGGCWELTWRRRWAMKFLKNIEYATASSLFYTKVTQLTQHDSSSSLISHFFHFSSRWLFNDVHNALRCWLHYDAVSETTMLAERRCSQNGDACKKYDWCSMTSCWCQTFFENLFNWLNYHHYEQALSHSANMQASMTLNLSDSLKPKFSSHLSANYSSTPTVRPSSMTRQFLSSEITQSFLIANRNNLAF